MFCACDLLLRVLAKLHGKGDTKHPTVLAQYKEIEWALRFEREDLAEGVWSLFTNKRVVGRVLLGMSIQAWSQLCGMNIMMCKSCKITTALGRHWLTGHIDYVVYIMEATEIASPLLTASFQYIINVVLTLPAILYLDKWGRRPSLIIGSFFMMTWLFISAGVQQRYGHLRSTPIEGDRNDSIRWVIEKNRTASAVVVACSYLFVATFATTWGPTSWTYPAEIFSGNIRAKAVGLSTAMNWLCNTALAFAVPPMRRFCLPLPTPIPILGAGGKAIE